MSHGPAAPHRATARHRAALIALGVIGAVMLAGCTNSTETASVEPSANAGGSSMAAVSATNTEASSDEGAAASVPGGPGEPIPPRTTPSTPSPPLVTTAEGGPEVVEFGAPDSFRCLADGIEGQATIGWSVPSATSVTVLLDGTPPATGIQDSLPYQIPAGPAPGVGSTIVFPCDSADQHTFTFVWALGDATTTRSVTLTREAAS